MANPAADAADFLFRMNVFLGVGWGGGEGMRRAWRGFLCCLLLILIGPYFDFLVSVLLA